MKAQSKKLWQEAESAEQAKFRFQLSAFGSSLRIGYDGKRATNNLTGLGNYSRSLIEHLAAGFPRNEYFVYTPKVKESTLKMSLFARKNVHVTLPPTGGSKLFWRTTGIKKQLLKDKIELFHGLSHEIPLGIKSTGIKSIVTIHDLIFLRRPEYYGFIDRAIYRFKSSYACKNADKIIAISDQTKKDIIELFGIDPLKIEVIYQSCDEIFKRLVSPEEKEKVTLKYRLPKNYLLYVGTIEARKNLLLLIRALPKVDKSFTLVVIGRATSYFKKVQEEIEKLGLQLRVIFLKDIPFTDLPSIYQLATTFVLPSYYEGFGIPIIEALYGKVPVVAATGSCLEEAGGPHSLYVSPDSSEDLANAINSILSDQRLQETMKEKGWQYVQRFNTDQVSKQLMDCYLNTLKQ